MFRPIGVLLPLLFGFCFGSGFHLAFFLQLFHGLHVKWVSFLLSFWFYFLILRDLRVLFRAVRLLNSLKISISTATNPTKAITVTTATTFKHLPTGKLFAGCHMSIKLTLEWQSKRADIQTDRPTDGQTAIIYICECVCVVFFN